MTLSWLAEIGPDATDAVLVTVAGAQGSTPREAGAKMLVCPGRLHGTIGGGHLEFAAAGFARDMLATAGDRLAAQRHLGRFALGPTLGQCCGGVVFLAFERVQGVAWAALLAGRCRQGLESWRVVALDAACPVALLDAHGAVVAGAAPVGPALLAQLQRAQRQVPAQACCLVRDAAGARWLLDAVLPDRAQLYLFGAGHVGAAIVRVLADLPCQVTWIDERAAQFPAHVPSNVTVAVCDFPEDLVASAPAGVSFLVMTHSHPLDQRLAQRILARGDAGWFGLIGSRTKRTQFTRRLRAQGMAPGAIAAMVCPVGIDGIDGKAPAVIAIGVAAQLLQAWEKQQARRDAGAAPQWQAGCA